MPKLIGNGVTKVDVSVDTEPKEVRKQLPNMNEFSPGSLDTSQVHQVLTLLKKGDGNRDEIRKLIVSAFPKIAATSDSIQRNKRADNLLIGMSQCGLIAIDLSVKPSKPSFTKFANELLAMTESEAMKRFSNHLLESAYGLELFDVVSLIRARGLVVSDKSIRTELRERGFAVTENEVNFGKIRQWLEPSGIVNDKWEVDDVALKTLSGLTTSVLDAWGGLTFQQKVFAKTVFQLDQVSVGTWITVRHVKKLCENAHGRSFFPEGRLREKIVVPLQAAGFLETSDVGTGRGGDSGSVLATDALRSQKIELPLENLSAIPAQLRKLLAKPISEIFNDLNDPSSKNTRGVALELLAWRLATDIGLFPVCFRERSSKTQQAEVDLIANGVNFHYSRWLIQCKNTKTVEVSDIAKEVGMAVVLKAQVILMVTTGRFTKTVRTYANGLAESSALQAVLLDGSVLKKYQEQGAAAVIEWLRENAFGVLALKKSQVQDVR